MSEKTAIIVGASKGVGKAIAEALAAQGYDLIIAARSKPSLDQLADSLHQRYKGNYKVVVLDIEHMGVLDAENFLKDCIVGSPVISDLFVTAGIVMDHDHGTKYTEVGFHSLSHINFNGPITVLSVFLKHFEDQKKGRAWVFSSIVIDAPRGKNVVYGAAKSGLDYYCRAMHHRLQNSPVGLSLIRLGYVDTDMTKGKKLLLPPASAESVARFVVQNLNHKFMLRYFPAYWGLLTFVLRSLPRSIYYKLKF